MPPMIPRHLVLFMRLVVRQRIPVLPWRREHLLPRIRRLLWRISAVPESRRHPCHLTVSSSIGAIGRHAGRERPEYPDARYFPTLGNWQAMGA
jgi:hypothetical protein